MEQYIAETTRKVGYSYYWMLAWNSAREKKYTPYGEAADIENEVLKAEAWLVDGLRSYGLVADRRSLRLYPSNMKWVWIDEGSLNLRFTLPRGGYATVLLRELCQVREYQIPKVDF